MKGQRIFTQITEDKVVESNWMLLPNGEKSYNVPAEPKMLPLDMVKEEGYPIVANTITPKMGMPSGGNCCGEMSKEVQIPVKLVAAADADGIARIGLHSTGFPIFGGLTAAENLTVTGKFAANTLEVIGQQAQFGKYHISRIHATASADSVFNTEMALKEVALNGRCLGDKEIYWEKSTTKDENLNVRNATFDYNEVVLNGMRYIEVFVPKGTSVDLSVFARYAK